MGQDDKDDKRIVLITGATGGLGTALSLLLGADRNNLLIICGRNKGRLEDLADKIFCRSKRNVVIADFDLTDKARLEELSSLIAMRFGRLDIFISASGYHPIFSPVTDIEDDVWSRAMEINFAVNQRLIGLLFPLFCRAVIKPRLIFLTCRQATANKAYTAALASSKAALEKMVKILEAENGDRLGINIYDPGAMDTQSRANSFPGEDKQKLTSPLAAARNIIKEFLS